VAGSAVMTLLGALGIPRHSAYGALGGSVCVVSGAGPIPRAMRRVAALFFPRAERFWAFSGSRRRNTGHSFAYCDPSGWTPSSRQVPRVTLRNPVTDVFFMPGLSRGGLA
jgi:hypothetical protein